jgi:ectoine hydroxylase-related dioxygenase (phytanoyl-CoA dioxygenase family)
MATSDYEKMLEDLGVRRDGLSDQERQSLDSEGYLVFPALLDSTTLDRLRTAFDAQIGLGADEAPTIYNKEDGALRIADCVNRGALFDPLIHAPRVLAAVDHIIGRPFKLDSYNGRDVLPGGGHQNLHADNPENPDPTSIANSLWLLDDFTLDNGATRVVPGSHRKTVPIQEELPDRKASHPHQIIVTAERGSVLVINGHIWHGGTRNTSGARRRVLLVSYVGRELPRQVDYRAHISPDTYARLSWADKYLLDVA